MARLNGCGAALAGAQAVVAAGCLRSAGDAAEAIRVSAVSGQAVDPAAGVPSGDLDALASFAARRQLPAAARDLARQAVLANPSDAQAQLRLGDALTCRFRQPWGYDRVFPGCEPDWPGALGAYGRSLAAQPSGEAYMALALAEHEAGDSISAWTALDSSLGLAASAPDRYYRYTLLGDWQLAAGNPALAAESYRAAAGDGFPVSPWWRSQYALALAQSGNG